MFQRPEFESKNMTHQPAYSFFSIDFEIKAENIESFDQLAEKINLNETYQSKEDLGKVREAKGLRGKVAIVCFASIPGNNRIPITAEHIKDVIIINGPNHTFMPNPWFNAEKYLMAETSSVRAFRL